LFQIRTGPIASSLRVEEALESLHQAHWGSDRVAAKVAITLNFKSGTDFQLLQTGVLPMSRTKKVFV
jgi:hypothetical protein